VVAELRAQAEELLASSRESAGTRLAEAAARAAAVEAEADQVLAQAQTEAERRLADASHRASRTVDEATTKVTAIESRADRREAEAEANARALRERVAEQVATAQRESEEARREARAEAVRIVGDARTEADELRRQAHQILHDAREEVAALTTRRDEIAAELGRLALDMNRLDIAQQTLKVAEAQGVKDWKTLSAQGTLRAKRGQHGEAGGAAGHHVAVIGEDRERVRGDRAGGYVNDRRRQLAGDLVHLRDHQEKALRGREGGASSRAAQRGRASAGGAARAPAAGPPTR